jgi:hypothetical protein
MAEQSQQFSDALEVMMVVVVVDEMMAVKLVREF